MRGPMIGLAGAAALVATPAFAKVACADIARHAPAHTRITSAEAVTAGALAGTEGGSAGTPGFCRIRGEIAAVPGSRVGFELWLPAQGWNGKFEMIGNGGYSSAIAFPAMARLLEAGYAVAATDTGHQGDDPDFALGHPEALVDWSWRAVHVTAVAAKALVKARYAQAPAHSYFSGCSTGGQQAMSEAERFPDDFDGIIAGASGGDRTHLNAGFLWQYLRNHRPDGSQILPASKLGMITRAVLAKCEPGSAWLDDPLACRFRPADIRCAGPDAPDCLTAEQAAALEAMYAGPHDPVTGRRIAPGYPKGSEATGGPPSLRGWSLYWADPQHPDRPARLGFWRVWAGFGADWDFRRFDFHRDMEKVDAKLAATVNAADPNLDGFIKRGHRLIAYHGEADPVVPFEDSIDLYQAVAAREGVDATDRAYRLFLVPGMAHCAGGPGFGLFEPQAALERWVEDGQAPESILAFQRGGASRAVTRFRPSQGPTSAR